MRDWKTALLIGIWQIGSVLTAGYLIFFDGYPYNAWNWIIAVPVAIFMGEIWPIYWPILRPIFGS